MVMTKFMTLTAVSVLLAAGRAHRLPTGTACDPVAN